MKITKNQKKWVSLTKKVMVKLDLTVCRQHWMRAALSPNRAPGQTVVPFSQFTTALVYAKMWKQGDMRAAGICKAIMATAFPFMHKKGATYEPLPLDVHEGNVHQYICEDVIKDRIEQMGQMELTAENCFLAAFDLQAIARYYVETIIDAAKNGKIVVIENVDNFDRKKEFSRQDLGFHVNWDTRAVEEDWQPRSLRNGQSYLLDVFQTLRKEAMAQAEGQMQELAKLEQKLPDETWGWVKKIALSPECSKYILFCKRMKEMYWSLNSIKRSYDEMLKRGLADDQAGSALVELRNKGVKEAYNVAFDRLRDQLRLVLANVSPLHRVALLVYVTFMYRRPEETKKQISSFAQQMLEEEFFQWVLMIYRKDLNVPRYTEDLLEEVRGFYDDDTDEDRTVEFVFGQYESDDGERFALAKSPELDGKYLVRKNGNGKWVASRKIRDLVQIPVPSENTLTFITKMSEDLRTEEADRNGLFNPGTVVTLLPGIKVNGQNEDAVIVNGKSVTEFRCDYLERSDTQGTAYKLNAKEQKQGGRWIKDDVTRALYNHMQGEVASVVGAQVKGERSRAQYVAIVTLKNVRKVTGVKVEGTTKGQKPVVANKTAADKVKKDVQFHSTFLGTEV